MPRGDPPFEAWGPCGSWSDGHPRLGTAQQGRFQEEQRKEEEEEKTEKQLLPVTKSLNHFLGSLVWVVSAFPSGTVRDFIPPQPSIPHKLL